VVDSGSTVEEDVVDVVRGDVELDVVSGTYDDYLIKWSA